MLLITKELALAVVSSYEDNEWLVCKHCGNKTYPQELHKDNCIVVRAKLLLEQEWDIKNDS